MNSRAKAAELLSLEGRVALVTGAASGIGWAISRRLAEVGASVLLLDIAADSGKQAAAEIQADEGKILFAPCDVRSDEDCRRAVELAAKEFGRVDILCNNAGLSIRKDCLELEEREWDLALDVMLKGIYLLSRRVIPTMIRGGGGSIINTGSGWSLKGGPKAVSYCAAKGGALNLTRAMAIDHGKDNIRVNCVCPGDVDTPLLRSECRQLGEDEDEFMRGAGRRPLARVGTVDDVANAVLFLASDMSGWITGTALVVDGGGLA